MNTVINIKTDSKIKKAAQKTAEDLGLSLSGVINSYLRQFVRSQTIFVSTKFSEPSELLLSALKEAQDERKKGNVYSFKQPKDAVDFVDKMIVEKNKK